MGFISNPSAAGGASSSSGTYNGNDSAGRAIPHGLGVVPRLIFIQKDGAVYNFSITRGSEIIVMHPGAGTQYAMTAMDATNFYVGDAGDYGNTANATGSTYHWTAIG